MQGFKQLEGRHFEETFVNVARLETLRLLCALAVLTGRKVDSFDVKQAYLISAWPQQFKIWITGPQGDPTPPGHGRRLLKSLYGNKAAGRYWGLHIDRILKEFGYRQYSKEGSLYVYHDGDKWSILVLYVDDGNLICDSDETQEEACAFLIDKLPKIEGGKTVVKRLGDCTETLNMKVEQRFENNKFSIHISQGKYIKKLMKRFNVVRTSKAPATKQLIEAAVDENAPLDFIREHQAKIGSIIHNANGANPGISYATNKLCSVMHSPNQHAMDSVDRVLRFLNSDHESGILFSHTGPPLRPNFEMSEPPGRLPPEATLSGAHLAPEPLTPDDNSVKTGDAAHTKGASDANWASPKSHTGWIFTLAGGAISWQSRLQSSTATSTSESESIAACSATRQAIYLRDTLRFCGFPQCKPTSIDIDNQAAIAWSKNKCGFNKRKHIDLSNWFIGDSVERGQVEFNKVESKANVSDILTKLLPSSVEFKKQLQRICTYKYENRFTQPNTT